MSEASKQAKTIFPWLTSEDIAKEYDETWVPTSNEYEKCAKEKWVPLEFHLSEVQKLQHKYEAEVVDNVMLKSAVEALNETRKKLEEENKKLKELLQEYNRQALDYEQKMESQREEALKILDYYEEFKDHIVVRKVRAVLEGKEEKEEI